MQLCSIGELARRGHQRPRLRHELPQAGPAQALGRAAARRGEVQRLVLVTRDRLLRFGAELVFAICAARGVEVDVLDQAADVPREQQFTEDLVEILTVFSSRLYGGRSRKNLRAVAAGG